MKNKRNRDFELIAEIVGSSFGNPGVSIESDYLVREKLENAKEQGYPVPVNDDNIRGVCERDDYRRMKIAEKLEVTRCPRYDSWYPGADEDDEKANWVRKPKKEKEIILWQV